MGLTADIRIHKDALREHLRQAHAGQKARPSSCAECSGLVRVLSALRSERDRRNRAGDDDA